MRFRNSFNENESGKKIAPDVYEKFLNRDLPPNVHYVTTNNQEFFLVPKDEEGILKFKFKINVKELFGDVEIASAKDLEELLYRTQKIVEGKTKDVIPSIGEDVIDLDKMVKIFGENVEFENGNFIIKPASFPPPFNMNYKLGDKNYSLKLVQKPYQSLTEVLIESVDEDIFHFKFKLSHNDQCNDERINMKINVSYNFNNADSLDSIIRQKEKLISYSSGYMEIFGTSIELNDGERDENIPKLVDFYEKLQAISTTLEREFDISKIIMKSDFINMNKLYYSFVKDKYYYFPELVEKFNLFFGEEFSPDEFLDKNMAITGFDEVELKLLGQTFQLNEQFIFKNARYLPTQNEDNLGNKLVFEALDDKIRYQKLFEKENPPKTIDFNELILHLNEACEIKLEEKNLSE
ncbi:abortive infection system toxin AbiGii family protein [Listeria costaricensis]|uniref:abortive infection system toxin AbiGii family protein n=1 Tax=Listeria costaricensis TaxID=2026604 RepID=UPI000C06FA59|nr:abortive infection system toxin AbiGii family protein [Listeria costaricensis]